jgi:hypothetical protein
MTRVDACRATDCTYNQSGHCKAPSININIAKFCSPSRAEPENRLFDSPDPLALLEHTT